MKDPATLVHIAMLAGIGAFIYVITRPETGGQAGDRIEGKKHRDPLKLWFEHVTAKPGTWEAREQAAEWMVRHAGDRSLLSFGMAALHGWLDLDVRGEDATATRKLIRELKPLFED